MFNNTPKGERLRIGFFGKTNAGKSSLLNAVASQDLAVVSDFKGTTTDPVYKSMELMPLGSVILADTPGLGDESELGKKRMLKTKQVLSKTDIAVLVCDAKDGVGDFEQKLILQFKNLNIPYITVFNKSDTVRIKKKLEKNQIYTSAKTKENLFELKEMLAKIKFEPKKKCRIIGDFISSGEVVILVTPIDGGAPKGRLILPQQQTIRDILDANAICVTTQETELEKTLLMLGKNVKAVVCDSQVFAYVNKIVPKTIPLTSFSILFARYKGLLSASLTGINKLDKLLTGDTVLISEGCSHHRQCGDIGTQKLPKWISEYTKKDLNFEFSSGEDFPENLTKYALVVHCGGCMLTENEFLYRRKLAEEQNIPITNYGVLIAKINGILERSETFLKNL